MRHARSGRCRGGTEPSAAAADKGSTRPAHGKPRVRRGGRPCRVAPMGEAKTTERPAVDVTYRRAEEADLPRAFAVFRAALNAYLVPAGQEGIPEDDQQSPVYRHFLEHDGERF